MPGISPHVARFARWVRDAGLTVYMPSLFGRDGDEARLFLIDKIARGAGKKKDTADHLAAYKHVTVLQLVEMRERAMEQEVRGRSHLLGAGGLARRYGGPRQSVLVNGALSGPEIRVRTGDTVRATVRNALLDGGTTVHWHGVLQKGTNFFDGVDGITQCAIPPGEAFAYTSSSLIRQIAELGGDPQRLVTMLPANVIEIISARQGRNPAS